MKNKKLQNLKIKGKAITFVDWANVYGWRKSLGYKPDPEKIFKYLSSYSEVEEVRFYYGEDSNKASKKFLESVKDIGYTLITKQVKYITVGKVENTEIRKRKADFDLEICLDCFDRIAEYNSFIFFSGDGDFAILYKKLIKLGKQVIVIFAPDRLGREIWEIDSGLFKTQIDYLGINNPRPDGYRGEA